MSKTIKGLEKVVAAFGRERVLLPVIHIAGRKEAEKSIEVAAEAGADGVLTINQGGSAAMALELLLFAQAKFPQFKGLGANLLGYAVPEGLGKVARSVPKVGTGPTPLLWVDNGQVYPGDKATGMMKAPAARYQPERLRHAQVLTMCGVAFKTQAPVPFEELKALAKAAARFMDVVTTSGAGTGVAADPARVAEMQAGLGPQGALGLASGVTPENVVKFLPFVNVFIVGTGIEKSFGILDPAKTRSLAQAIHEYHPPTTP